MKDEIAIIELTEENIESMIYEIRGQRVMLDFDLAKIYGYETKYLNRQVQRNINKFPDDFMFQLTEIESNKILKCQNVTSSWGGTRKLPYAFTEQGIYMLMTVLKGELATKQSIALIKAFKQMKDYIASSNGLMNINEILKLSRQVSDNTQSIKQLEKDSEEIKLQLETVMGNFINPSKYNSFLILNGEKIEAEIAFQSIYELAKESILIVDDYISIKTLQLLLSAKEEVEIIIASDNVSKNKLTYEQLEEFVKESNLNITLKKSKGICHDRWIIIDYNTQNEQLFISGASSKDAGNKITTIMKEEHSELYHPLIDKIFFNK